MKIEVCYAEGGKGSWLDYEPGFPLPRGEFPDDVLDVVSRVPTLPDGMVGLRVTTQTEVWAFQYHPTYGCVPRLVNDAGEVTEVWPTNAEVGGIWQVCHVLPDGHVLPMVYVEPEGAFAMGDPADKTQKKVSVPGGFVALTPTTVEQWNWFAVATGLPLKAVTVTDKTGTIIDLRRHPVVDVSYWDACAFAEWAGVGIPTEAVWEHAARSNDGRKFPWGNDAPARDTCHSSIQVQQERTDNVFNRPKGASPYGCLDMSGNVWEWTSTVHK